MTRRTSPGPKVLPEQLTKDPQRLARFDREAKLRAQLNHPNIGQIYGIEDAEAGATKALVLQLIEGPSLIFSATTLASKTLTNVEISGAVQPAPLTV